VFCLQKKIIEIWADSFHEGNWCCENISKCAVDMGASISLEYLNGFQPKYVIKTATYELSLIVYGSYKSWSPMPTPIKELINWGKPDFIAYDSENDKILFAVEETAATPTGNQATQRCERQYGSARFKIPYWYLISEFGVHRDGGVRRDSIWPTIAAIKLSIIKRTPCVVLHYSDINNPEDYSIGTGLNLLFKSLHKLLVNYVQEIDILNGMKDYLVEQYKEMLVFLLSQWENVIDFLPSEALIKDFQNTSKYIAEFAVNDPSADRSKLNGLLEWPTIANIPKAIRDKQTAKPLLKYDKLCSLFERDLGLGKAYSLSNNAGSGKPPTADKISLWIAQQKALFDRSPKLEPEAVFTMKTSDFPDTGSNENRRHITTAKNIVYLYDSWNELKTTIEEAFPRLKGKLVSPYGDIPVFVYVSNSLKPGRLFGDPFTGQISAFSIAFGKFDPAKRMVIAYFPHQVHTQAILNGVVSENKGITIMTELTDYIIFHAGVAVSLSNGRVI